jgi:chromosomal replication initiator protein
VENRGGLVYIAVPNPYAKNWLENNLLKELSAACQDEFDDFQEIRFEVRETKASPAMNDLPLLDHEEPTQEPAEPIKHEVSSGFNPRYTFSNFVVGNNNRLAFAASQVVAEKPGESYNPLFIYGGVGLGKTHLMHAVANEILRHNPKKKIVFISCETFASEFVEALRSNSINEFKKKYRSVDVLLVDDIQFLANKEGTQEEFFHTFNALHQSNRQIIVTADRVPKEINQLEDRLASRFGWGMIADIQPPNFENRIAILKSKADERNINIPDDALEYIANTITSNVRELEGSLIKLAATASLDQEDITKQYTVRVLKDLTHTADSRLSTKQIIKKVAEYFNIEITDILGKKRSKEIVYPRQVAMYLIKEKLDHSYPQIGDEFGGKDHTTVMHSVNKIESEIKTNPSVETDIQNIHKLFI